MLSYVNVINLYVRLWLWLWLWLWFCIGQVLQSLENHDVVTTSPCQTTSSTPRFDWIEPEASPSSFAIGFNTSPQPHALTINRIDGLLENKREPSCPRIGLGFVVIALIPRAEVIL